jgi:hypothetical protein
VLHIQDRNKNYGFKKDQKPNWCTVWQEQETTLKEHLTKWKKALVKV